MGLVKFSIFQISSTFIANVRELVFTRENRACYKFVYQMYSADEAKGKCESLGTQIGTFGEYEGYLATIQVYFIFKWH